MALLLAVIYLAYISLGLPDSIFGSAWPAMHPALGAQVSWAGAFTVLTSSCGALSSFASGQLIRRFGTYRVTIVSILLTVAGLLGMSLAGSFGTVCLMAIPLGLGAGCIDAALNSFVSLNFSARHINWLHCCWGIGATAGPALVSLVISRPEGWRAGYGLIGCIQLGIAFVVLASHPLWRAAIPHACTSSPGQKEGDNTCPPLRTPGVKTAVAVFFLYCGLEYLCGTWGATYYVQAKGLTENIAARLCATFYLGITLGRLSCGFLSYRLSSRRLVSFGLTVLALGPGCMLAPWQALNLAAYLLMGLGCAPLYPCLIHCTPQVFGQALAPAVIGLQMGFAVVGGMVCPALFGLLVRTSSVSILPLCALALSIPMALGIHVMLRPLDRTQNASLGPS